MPRYPTCSLLAQRQRFFIIFKERVATTLLMRGLLTLRFSYARNVFSPGLGGFTPRGPTAADKRLYDALRRQAPMLRDLWVDIDWKSARHDAVIHLLAKD